MKRIIILLLTLVTVAAHSQEQEKKVTKRSSRTVSTIHRTSVSGWEWKTDQWWYANAPTDTVPPSYSITEEVSEMYWENGVETKKRYRTTLEVSTKCTTTSPGWTWRDGYWYHDGEKVNVLPPSYEYVKKESKTTVNLDYDTGEELK